MYIRIRDDIARWLCSVNHVVGSINQCNSSVALELKKLNEFVDEVRFDISRYAESVGGDHVAVTHLVELLNDAKGQYSRRLIGASK